METATVSTEQDRDLNDDMSIWNAFVDVPKGTSTTRAIIEMQRYLEEPVLSRQDNSLLWWRKHMQMLPFLSKIAQEKLCTLAISVPCESLFSKAGETLTERRNRLSDKKTQTI